MVEYMGLMSISAVLKKAGHEVEVFIDTYLRQDRFVKDIKRFNPDIVGLSILTPSVPWALNAVKRIKKETTALTVLGGIHAITTPEIINEEGVDIVCLGEGESCMEELCSALDRGLDYTAIEGLWVKKDGLIHHNAKLSTLEDIEALPYPDRALYNKYAYFHNSRFLRLLISRGCPFSCTFCYNPVLREQFGGKGYLRRLSPESAIAFIENMINNHPRPVRHLYFADEVLWTNNIWLREFLTLYKKKINLPFTAAFRFGPIEEKDIQLMADAGAWAMGVSAETGDEQQRINLLGKHVSNDHIIEVTGWLRKYGILYATTVMFGLPGDTVADHVKRLDFYRSLHANYVWTAFFQPYPGIALCAHPAVIAAMPKDTKFNVTFHHNMTLDLPERDRLIRLKKIYDLCVRFPLLEKPLVALTRYRIPFLFDILFFLHFTYYALRAEKLSLFQYMYHIKLSIVMPLFRR